MSSRWISKRGLALPRGTLMVVLLLVLFSYAISKSMVHPTAAVVPPFFGYGTELNGPKYKYHWIVPNVRHTSPYGPVYATAPTGERYATAYEMEVQVQRIA
ncbi:hypothetical protein AVEN_177423-1 [Araneus ventricosus]|uniref:Uncharacterized protein n=1 Tax=Araneus ventricosus TaxID=182803 RepID=A0A4Y2IML4_ARAVE|nr:hypothetical protein AVEN_177423-1 [Araneus ventricosus]